MSDTTKSAPITLRIPLELLAALKERAQREDRSLASLIVHLARKGLNGE